MVRRALLACLDEAQASSQGGQGSLPPSPPDSACTEREQAAGLPACVEDAAAKPQPAATCSSGGSSASSLQGSDQQQLPRGGAPAVSGLECARAAPARRAGQGHAQCGSAPVPSQAESATAAPAARGQPQRGRAPGASQTDSTSKAAGALADLRLESAPRRRLPSSRSLCYGEGPAVLDERCTGRDARSAAADERCDDRASSPADECCDGRVSSPSVKGSGHNGSSAGRARAGARCAATSAGPAPAPGGSCRSGAEPTQEPTQGPWRLEDAQALVVYGLGSLEGGPAPRYQLALALLLAARMPALRPPIQVRVCAGVACCSAPPTQPC